MPESKLILHPGVSTQASPTLNSASWSSCNLIRFQQGFIQNIGGWQAFNNTPLVGTCRTMHAWQDLAGNKYLACGTNQRLQLYSAGVQYDITPIIDTDTLTNAFSTTISTPTVEIHDVANGAAVGDWVYVQIPLAIGGLVLFGYYQVATVVDADNYTVTAASAATSSVALGGLTPKFTTIMGSAVVTVTLINHNYTAGQIFTVQISTIVGGLTFLGEYVVQTVPGSTTFTIDGGAPAGSSTSGFENGGDEIVDYLLPSGPETTVALTGWGGGGWGLGGWGESSAIAAFNPARIWTLDNFGELLLAQVLNGGLYVWTPTPALGNVATLVATAPDNNIGMFVAMPQAQAIIYGAEVTGSQDALLIRWSDTGDYTDYVPTVSNQAGSYRLSRGSRIVGGFQAAQTALIWTDEDLWSMIYQGPPFIYSINTVGLNCGLIAQNAAAVLAANIYWMSLKGFFALRGGSVSPMPCSVWDQVFQDLDTANQDKCIAGANTPFNEVFFFYPSLSGGTGEIDSYVKVCLEAASSISASYAQSPLWDYGSLVRTAWIDQNQFGMPLGVDDDGLIQQHEMGYTNNGVPMDNVFALSGYADIADGEMVPFVDRIIPDFRFYDASASAQYEIYTLQYPFSDPAVHGPYSIDTTTQFISMRARARQVAFRVDFDGQSFVRLGANRYRIAPSGRR